jgi:D-sedoheptulose 7-phosphate isomerase
MMFTRMIDDHIQCFENLKSLTPLVDEAGDLLLHALVEGRKILVCGNGGSAADAQHFAAEIVGRFETERRAYPAVSLATDTSILTAVANDYGYDAVFSRQVAGLGAPGDIMLGISTSGRSKNVIRAVETASSMGMRTIGLLGGDGGDLKVLVDQAVVVQETATARIQEGHGFILHYWAWRIDKGLPKQQDDQP